eukprot:GHVN01079757.1.p1 GENE.GHVN01079757.1~~GHVN01079757.1.p1  ORF type:complete len:248 (+),score=59.90 GHVN01079757.1:170-913(+)
MPDIKWQQVAIGAAAASVGGAFLWYLLKSDENNDGVTQRTLNMAADTKSEKEKVEDTLNELLENQAETKTTLRNLTKEVIDKKLDFQETYKRVRDVQPRDPLETYGFSMQEFDAYLEKYSTDPVIRSLINRVMSASPNTQSVKGAEIGVNQLLQVHELMLSELSKLVDEFLGLSDKANYDIKGVVIAAQAIIGAKVEEKFKLNSEEVEAAVVHNHPILATNRDFTRMNISITSKMNQLMGAEFQPFA